MATVNGVENKQKSLVWSRDQDLQLYAKVEEHINSFEKKKHVYIKDISWSEIAFNGYSEHEVQKRWNTLTSKIRKVRTAKEVLEDAKAQGKEDRSIRKRKREDSNQPKMPKTAYLLFCEYKRPLLAAKYSSLGSKEMMVKMGKKWQKLSDEKKAKYREMYRVSRQQYERDLAHYYLEQNPEAMPPKTAFDLWSERKASELKQSRPDISERKLNKKLAKYWERLEDKEQWENKAKKEFENFVTKMKKKSQGS